MKPDDLAYFYSLTNEYRSIRYDLRNMQALSAVLGNPHEAFRSVLIAGTNGKGSIAGLLSAMMPEAGLYTSPHLVRLNERIRIGNQEITDEDLKTVFDQVKTAAAQAKDLLYPPSYFEIVTAMAFLYFRERVKFAVLEAGLGGRLDATNVVKQDVSVITSIGLDHQEFLGTTVDAIAAEKAGIIKDTEPVVIGPMADLPAITAKAGTRLIRAGDLEKKVRSLGQGYFELDIGQYRNLRPRLAGRHQIDNVAVAVCTAECWGLPARAIARGVNTAVWPGRLERIGKFLLDGAHNVAAATALAAFLEEFYPQGVWMIFGAMADKQFQEMIAILRPHVHQFIFTKAQSSRAKDPEDLARLVAGSRVERSVADAIQFARTHAPPDATIVICGSLYLIGEARPVLE
ncbi:MAG: bifunctional folylpolyglutamate synthase/dihydrofolate synthase [Acidobacteria bacterium]|nr:MAG: bifunctional folylpolyglutamate synthase/dihydrofolate synthase [Acidobacteriota bacterium]